MLLAGDIGGTKTRLALFAPDTGLQPRIEVTFPSEDYASLEAIVAEFLAETGATVENAAFGVAGPVVDGRSDITNLDWIISEASLRQAFGLEAVKLLNDLEATGYGVLHLSPEDFAPLNEAPAQEGTKAILAPGTGLGEAILFYDGNRYHVIPSEGGHTDFGPTSLLEIRLLRQMLGKFGHVSYERFASGSGLPNIYAFFKKKGFASELPEMKQALRKADDPTPIIVEKAMAGQCELSIATLNTFVSILGAEASNLALTVMATGGIYLGGGIPPKILPKLKDGTFMASFVNKGRFAEMLAQIPVCVILNDRAALLGAAAYGLGL